MVIGTMILLWFVAWNVATVTSVPEGTLNLHANSERFQNALERQTFQNVLLAIEERLRNLDNLYSMQLSETLESKLDAYRRKLDALDSKIVRLESAVMLNLDKISENISTKNYKDDMAKTQIQRKLDNVYEGVVHRMGYMEKKFETALDKIQNKVDSTLQRLERMEEDSIQRNADLESEISETLSMLENHKTPSVDAKQILLNLTELLNDSISEQSISKALAPPLSRMTKDFNQLVRNTWGRLQQDIAATLNASAEVITLLNSTKMELKDDFNAYANKVADMNVDIWQRNDVAEESLKTLENLTNSTRIDVQNGLRSIMLLIGKTFGKGAINNDRSQFDSLKKSVDQSLEKIMTNQELFLESCHRVQMDESQIESEISVMLGKLIDMLELKMTIVMKDLKSIEKSVKNSESRTSRNLNQANTNIISLFEKTTKANEWMQKEFANIKNYLSYLVQELTPIIEEQKNKENLTTLVTKKNGEIIASVNQINELILLKTNLLTNRLNNATDQQAKISKEIRGMIFDLPKKIKQFPITKKNCSANYGDLIDIRAGDDCLEEKTHIAEDEQLKKAVLEVFGTEPTQLKTGCLNNCTDTLKKTKGKRKGRKKQKLTSRFNQDEIDEDNDDEEVTEATTEITSTMEPFTTESIDTTTT